MIEGKIRYLGLLLLMFALGTFQSYSQTWEKYKAPKIDNKVVVHDTRYDFTDFARKITAGAHSDYQKIRAIYQWICWNRKGRI